MPYEDAAGYRFNPFDLTKVWPHEDYPEIEVGTMTLDTNPENYFAQIEQATFAPSNFVPGIDASPDKMLQARIFSYADAHRYRVGTNHQQLPVNAPRTEVHSYSKEGAMNYAFPPASKPVYAPNSFGGPHADPARAAEAGGWQSDGELVRSAVTLHAEDDDFAQANALVNQVMDQEQRERLARNVTGHVAKVTDPEIRDRAVQYWRNVDAWLGEQVAQGLPPMSTSTQPGEQVSEPTPAVGRLGRATTSRSPRADPFASRSGAVSARAVRLGSRRGARPCRPPSGAGCGGRTGRRSSGTAARRPPRRDPARRARPGPPRAARPRRARRRPPQPTAPRRRPT